MSDEEYAVGRVCTWHGPLTFAERDKAGAPICPKCGQALKPVSKAAFWHDIRVLERNKTGAAKMVGWSEGKCFLDADTLENAYRQAMAEQL